MSACDACGDVAEPDALFDGLCAECAEEAQRERDRDRAEYYRDMMIETRLEELLERRGGIR